jgi:choline dehydrogenase-like flavoprotein
MIDTSNKEIQNHYDFIVVGAGAAGSVLAAELSASGAQVLVVESGGPDDGPTISNPSIWFYNVGGPLDYHLPVNPSPRLRTGEFVDQSQVRHSRTRRGTLESRGGFASVRIPARYRILTRSARAGARDRGGDAGFT